MLESYRGAELWLYRQVQALRSPVASALPRASSLDRSAPKQRRFSSCADLRVGTAYTVVSLNPDVEFIGK